MNRFQKRNAAFEQLQKRGLIGQGARLTDTNKYLVVDISGASGIFPLMDSNTKKSVGVTNFDGNKLNAGRHLVIDGIKIEKATSGTTRETAQFSGNTVLPAELSNTEFRVEQKGLIPIDIPTTEVNQRGEYIFGVHYRDFSTAPVLVASEEIGMFLQFPAGVTAPAGTIIRISFDCHQIKTDN
jgi:hypothetical protein